MIQFNSGVVDGAEHPQFAATTWREQTKQDAAWIWRISDATELIEGMSHQNELLAFFASEDDLKHQTSESYHAMRILIGLKLGESPAFFASTPITNTAGTCQQPDRVIILK